MLLLDVFQTIIITAGYLRSLVMTFFFFISRPSFSHEIQDAGYNNQYFEAAAPESKNASKKLGNFETSEMNYVTNQIASNAGNYSTSESNYQFPNCSDGSVYPYTATSKSMQVSSPSATVLQIYVRLPDGQSIPFEIPAKPVLGNSNDSSSDLINTVSADAASISLDAASAVINANASMMISGKQSTANEIILDPGLPIQQHLLAQDEVVKNSVMTERRMVQPQAKPMSNCAPLPSMLPVVNAIGTANSSQPSLAKRVSYVILQMVLKL